MDACGAGVLTESVSRITPIRKSKWSKSSLYSILCDTRRLFLSSTPHKERRTLPDTTKLREAREQMGRAMNTEMVACTLDEFMKEYLPWSTRDNGAEEAILRRIDEANVKWPKHPAKSRLTEERAFQPLYDLINVIRTDTQKYADKERNHLNFRLTGNTRVTSDNDPFNQGTHRVDACLTDVPDGSLKRLKRFNEIVPMEFKVSRRRDDIRAVSVLLHRSAPRFDTICWQNRLQILAAANWALSKDRHRDFMFAVSHTPSPTD